MVRADLKRLAKQQLSGHWGMAALVMLVYSAIIGGLSGLGVFAMGTFNPITLMYEGGSPMLSGLANLALFLVSGAFMYGLYNVFVVLARTGELEVGTLFSGFPMFFKCFGLAFMISLFTFLWSLLFVIPGIVAAYRYRMAFYLLIDNPDIGIMEAIRESKEMMRGHKGELFILDWSFFWWILLGLVTFGIGMFWISPYMQETEVNYYEYLRGAADGSATAQAM